MLASQSSSLPAKNSIWLCTGKQTPAGGLIYLLQKCTRIAVEMQSPGCPVVDHLLQQDRKAAAGALGESAQLLKHLFPECDVSLAAVVW
jgi:hypothetical protein